MVLDVGELEAVEVEREALALGDRHVLDGTCQQLDGVAIHGSFDSSLDRCVVLVTDLGSSSNTICAVSVLNRRKPLCAILRRNLSRERPTGDGNRMIGIIKFGHRIVRPTVRLYGS